MPPPSGVRPNSLVNKTLLPASSHFYAHPHPFPTDGAIPRTLVMCLCLLKTPRLNPGVAHATLHRRFRHCASLFCLLRARSCCEIKGSIFLPTSSSRPTRIKSGSGAGSIRGLQAPSHTCIQFAPPHHEKSEHSMVYDQQVQYQRRNRAVPPVRASSCPQSTLVCEAAVFETVIVKKIRSI